jgi:hypothetical protein
MGIIIIIIMIIIIIIIIIIITIIIIIIITMFLYDCSSIFLLDYLVIYLSYSITSCFCSFILSIYLRLIAY